MTSYVDLARKIFSFTDSDDVNVRSFVIVTQVHEAVSFLFPQSIFSLCLGWVMSIVLSSSSLILSFSEFKNFGYCIKFPFGSSLYLPFLC